MRVKKTNCEHNKLRIDPTGGINLAFLDARTKIFRDFKIRMLVSNLRQGTCKNSLGANYNANCKDIHYNHLCLTDFSSHITPRLKIMNENMFSSEKPISTGHKKEFIDIFLAALYL